MTGIMACPSCGSAAENQMGHVIPEAYDGVLYWVCLTCHDIRPRDFGDWDRMNEVARAVVESEKDAVWRERAERLRDE